MVKRNILSIRPKDNVVTVHFLTLYIIIIVFVLWPVIPLHLMQEICLKQFFILPKTLSFAWSCDSKILEELGHQSLYVISFDGCYSSPIVQDFSWSVRKITFLVHNDIERTFYLYFQFFKLLYFNVCHKLFCNLATTYLFNFYQIWSYITIFSKSITLYIMPW